MPKNNKTYIKSNDVHNYSCGNCNYFRPTESKRMTRLIHKLHQKKCDKSGRTIDRDTQESQIDSTSNRYDTTYYDKERTNYGQNGRIIDTQIL